MVGERGKYEGKLQVHIGVPTYHYSNGRYRKIIDVHSEKEHTHPRLIQLLDKKPQK